MKTGGEEGSCWATPGSLCRRKRVGKRKCVEGNAIGERGRPSDPEGKRGGGEATAGGAVGSSGEEGGGCPVARHGDRCTGAREDAACSSDASPSRL